MQQPEPCRYWTRLRHDQTLVITLPDGTELTVRKEGRNVVVDAPAEVRMEHIGRQDIKR